MASIHSPAKASTQCQAAHASRAVVCHAKKPTAHFSTFGFLPTNKANAEKPKELKFSPPARQEIPK
jgi:Tfp pilus assembly protein PilV